MTNPTAQAATQTEEESSTGEPPDRPIPEIIESLKKAIWSRRPILGEIMTKHGGKSLYDYARDFMDVNKSPRLDARKEELIQVVQDLLSKRLGDQVGGEVAAQLRKLPLVSTADHHATIDHPFWVNANMISAIPALQGFSETMKYLVVFSFAGVSANNASGYPRGIEFHGGINGSGNFIRLPILPDSMKMGAVYGLRAFTQEDLTKTEQQLSKREKSGEIAHGRGDQIRDLLKREFSRTDVLSAPDLAAQITLINYQMWPHLFHRAEDAGIDAPHSPVPDLIYLEIETIVAEMLQKIHLRNTESLLHKALFNPLFTEQILKLFNGLPGAFSLEKEWGTYMFWGLEEGKNHRIMLLNKDGKLQSRDGQFTVPLTPEGIGEALRAKRIVPGMLLLYLTVSLYYGFKCLGGFCQVHDLTVMKEAWMQLLRNLGMQEEADAVVPVQTKELGGDGMVLSYFKTPAGELVPATGLDMLLEPTDTTFARFCELSKTVTLMDAMNCMLPEIYTVLYPVTERDAALTITPEEILRNTGLGAKILADRENWGK